MKIRPGLMSALLATLVSLDPGAQASSTDSPRLELAADAGWKFLLGDPAGAEAPSFADASWRTVALPHDWSIESRPDKSNPSGAGGGFFPAGTGWYRKTFSAPVDWKGKRVNVQFDGVYRNATVFLNGHKLGMQPYGYTSFELDLTPGLNFSGPNVLAVRVDNSAQPNSRWYSGSGIYRHVRVVVTNAAHVAHWGVFVTSPEVADARAKVQIRTTVSNESTGDAGLAVQTTLLDHNGKDMGRTQASVQVSAGGEKETSQDIFVENPFALVARVANLVPRCHASAQGWAQCR